MLQENVAMQIIATVAGGQEEMLLSRDDWLLDILSLVELRKSSIYERARWRTADAIIYSAEYREHEALAAFATNCSVLHDEKCVRSYGRMVRGCRSGGGLPAATKRQRGVLEE